MKVVFAYDGGDDGALAIQSLGDRAGIEIVTVTLDVGQTATLEDGRERALTLGAARAHVVDARSEFVVDFLWPALAAGALRQQPMVVRQLAHLVVARQLAQIAALEEADAVAHGAKSAEVADRFERALADLNGSLIVLAPARETLLSDERGTTANPWAWSVAEALRPAPGALMARLDVGFECGRPLTVNEVALEPVDVVTTVGTIADSQHVEHPRVPAAPLLALAARILTAAHGALCHEVWPASLRGIADDVGARYAALISAGEWFGPTRAALDAFVTSAQQNVTGHVLVEIDANGYRVAEVRTAQAADDVRVAASPGKDS